MLISLISQQTLNVLQLRFHFVRLYTSKLSLVSLRDRRFHTAVSPYCNSVVAYSFWEGRYLG